MGAGKILLGVVAGVAIGATLGLLLAPDSGANSRRKISSKGDEYIDGLEDMFHEFMENITSKFEDMKQDASRITEKAEPQMDKMQTEGSV